MKEIIETTSHDHHHDNEHDHDHHHVEILFEHKVAFIAYFCLFIFMNKIIHTKHTHKKI